MGTPRMGGWILVASAVLMIYAISSVTGCGRMPEKSIDIELSHGQIEYTVGEDGIGVVEFENTVGQHCTLVGLKDHPVALSCAFEQSEYLPRPQ